MIPRSATGRNEHTIVVALGGNAIQPEGGTGDIHEQFRHTRESLGAIVELARRDWRIAIVHGNGPQIGDELLRTELARAQLPPLPLGVLVAGTAGWIGYIIQQSLQNALAAQRIERSVVTLITQVLVDPDEARARPTKPIGRSMDAEHAKVIASQQGWTVGPDGDRWRRLVPSPTPIEIIEADEIRRLVDDGVIVVAAGGGGIPVYRHPILRLEGVDAVIDKDRAAEILAAHLGASVLLILTDVDGVFRNYDTPQAELIPQLDVNRAEQMLDAGEFGEGSMGPKVEAAIAFIRNGGSRAIIGRLDQGLEAVMGKAGTAIVA